MIKVTRLNQSELVVNCDLIEFVESTPETILSLTTGKKIMVTEGVDEIISRVADFKRKSGIRINHSDTSAVSDRS